MQQSHTLVKHTLEQQSSTPCSGTFRRGPHTATAAGLISHNICQTTLCPPPNNSPPHPLHTHRPEEVDDGVPVPVPAAGGTYYTKMTMEYQYQYLAIRQGPHPPPTPPQSPFGFSWAPTHNTCTHIHTHTHTWVACRHTHTHTWVACKHGQGTWEDTHEGI